MPHHTPLIGTIVAGIVAAFLMGAIAQRLRVSPVAGYLLAGILVGPFTPGIVANTVVATELAEIGVILLMFGVGLHFSLRDLLSVRAIAVPGALVQIAVATLLGLALALSMGWSLIAGLVFGLALSVASTVVLLRALQGPDLLNTEKGRIAVGWLIVEDLAMVLTLVLLPAIAGLRDGTSQGGAGIAATFGITVLKVCGFIAFMLVVGRRVIPSVLHWVAHSGSRELFRLAVLAIALGVAFGAAATFDVSFALGAFFAGMILGETPLSRRATEETLPLRDAFAVLFFVSVGMLFDPAVLIEQPLPLAATVGIILIGKSLAAYAIVRAFGHGSQTALVVAAGLAQIGEFSFILAGLGVGLGMLPEEGRDLILAGAIISIFANPLLFTAIAGRLAANRKGEPDAAVAPPPDSQETPGVADGEHRRERHDRVILIGYGRLGQLVAQDIAVAGRTLVIIEEEPDLARKAADKGYRVVIGNAAHPPVLTDAGIDESDKLIVAIPEGYEGGAIVERARKLNPRLLILARAHSDTEAAHLESMGADHVFVGEREIARTIINLATSPGKDRSAHPVPPAPSHHAA